MPGASAATQSSRCGRSPNEPSRVSAIISNTPVSSAKIWNGSRILRCMSCCMRGLRLRFRLGLLSFVDGPDHVERALRAVLEFIAQDALAAIKRVFETDGLAFETGEFLGSE